MKLIKCLLLLSIATLVIGSNIMALKAEEPRLFKVSVNADYQNIQGKNGHTYPHMSSHFPSEIDWKNFPVEITDPSGKIYHPENGEYNLRYVGMFPVGTILTVKVNPNDVPDGYHISMTYSPDFGIEYTTFKYKVTDRDDQGIRISFGKTDLVFDLMGGNVDGSSERITKRIGKDNKVDFPNATKENLLLYGWYTENNTPVNNRVIGKRYHNPKGDYSDYSHEWQSYNEESFDPKYDGKFVLRAQWVGLVEFDSDGGSDVKKQYVEEGKTVTKPEDPTKEKFSFGHWVDENSTKYDFNTPVTKNMKLKAIWLENPVVDKIKEGDKSILIKDPLNVNKIEITLPNGDKVTINKDTDGSWKLGDGEVVPVKDGKLVVPLKNIELKENDKITVINSDGSTTTTPLEINVEAKDKGSNKPTPDVDNAPTPVVPVDDTDYAKLNKVLPATGVK